MRLKGTDKALRTIGQELNVRYVLEGTVRKAGNSIRITSQLIDAATDTHLWADNYSGTLEDVFDIQERVSRAIAKALQVELTADDDRRVATRPIEDVRAYECYLQAKYEIFRFTQEGLNRALELLRQGLEIVGENALLYTTLGMVYWQHVNTGLDSTERYLQQAEECARKAFDLEPEFAPAHCLRGLVWWHRGNAQEAAREFKHAFTRDPDHAQALLFRAAVLATVGQEWTAEADRLLAVDPLTPFNQIVPVWGHCIRGRFTSAVAEGRRWLARDPESPIAPLLLGDTLARDGHTNDAVSDLAELAARLPETMFGQVALFLGHALAGRMNEAAQTVTPTLTESARFDVQYSWELV
jgi:tetratricopeptide (TPR) repeat protein